MLRLSQAQLTWLETCPRRFQLSSSDALAVPPSPAQWEAQQWGDRFHLLMQQREMGLPINPVLAQDDELRACFEQLRQRAPDLFEPSGETFRQSEHSRSQQVNGYWLTGVYDLLRQWRDRAEIVDWKTHLFPKDRQLLIQDWQTRLYLYLLVETSSFRPDQVSMTYWFVRSRDRVTGDPAPQQIRIAYTPARHQQTHADLLRLTQQLTELLAAGPPFPQVPPDSPACTTCPFALRCHRPQGISAPPLDLPDLSAIAEIPL